jgi:hypothetical protein
VTARDVLDGIRKRAKAYTDHGTPGLAAPRDRAGLLAAVEAALALAEAWTARGEHDMAYSKTVPDEYIAMELLTNGADMVENARHIRNAIENALDPQ